MFRPIQHVSDSPLFCNGLQNFAQILPGSSELRRRSVEFFQYSADIHSPYITHVNPILRKRYGHGAEILRDPAGVPSDLTQKTLKKLTSTSSFRQVGGLRLPGGAIPGAHPEASGTRGCSSCSHRWWSNRQGTCPCTFAV